MEEEGWKRNHGSGSTDEEEEEDPCKNELKLAELHHNIIFWKGWKLSYRTREPEKVAIDVTSLKIGRKISASVDQPFDMVTHNARLTKTLAERKAVAKGARLRARAKAAEAKKALGLNPR